MPMVGFPTLVIFVAGSILGLVPPSSRTAEMPDSWLVLYNASVPDGLAWAQWYAAQRHIPTEQVIGLATSPDEHLPDSDTAEAQIFSPVRAFLANNPAIAARVMGIIVGYGIPGHFGTVDYGVGGCSVACALQDMADTLFNLNPDCPHQWGNTLPAQRLTKATMTPGHYMVSRIDSGSLDVAKAITIRANGIWGARTVLPGHYLYYDYTDPRMGTWLALKQVVENLSFASLPWQSFDDDTQQTPDDAFRFGWHDTQNWNDSRLRGAAAGPRILAYNLNSWGATTVRSNTAEGGRYVPNAIDAGYAAAIGSTGEPRTASAPYPDTILAGLMAGWTLGECFYLANPYDDFMWEVVGDPFLRVPDWALPRGSHADYDGDGDVDATDFLAFEACFNGPNKPVRAQCVAEDADQDGDVDLADFDKFQACFNGPNTPPAPNCPM
jgi:uncharacterized protein (TIGR03790 family)